MLSFVKSLLTNKINWVDASDNGDDLENTEDTSEKMTKPMQQELCLLNSNIKILFGSQTGTSEGFSYDLNECFKKNHLNNSVVIDLEDYDYKNIQYEESVLVFMMSTYGEGEPTDNAAEFYYWLREHNESAIKLNNLKYIVYGLGNSQYELYCTPALELDTKLSYLGGNCLLNVDLYDDDSPTFPDQFVDWMNKKILPTLIDFYFVPFVRKLCLKLVGKDIASVIISYYKYTNL